VGLRHYRNGLYSPLISHSWTQWTRPTASPSIVHVATSSSQASWRPHCTHSRSCGGTRSALIHVRTTRQLLTARSACGRRRTHGPIMYTEVSVSVPPRYLLNGRQLYSPVSRDTDCRPTVGGVYTFLEGLYVIGVL